MSYIYIVIQNRKEMQTLKIIITIILAWLAFGFIAYSTFILISTKKFYTRRLLKNCFIYGFVSFCVAVANLFLMSIEETNE